MSAVAQPARPSKLNPASDAATATGTATTAPTTQARDASFTARSRRGRAKSRTRFQVPPSRSLETRS